MVRRLAAKMYSLGGRGVFLIEISDDAPRVLTEESLAYISRERALRENDDDLKTMVSGVALTYNPEREIAFLFSSADQPLHVYNRVLKEYPNGTPRPSTDELNRHWAGIERGCPRCWRRFISLRDFGTCPRCWKPFLASEAAYVAMKAETVPPIAKYCPPLEAPISFDELYERISELVSREGCDCLSPQRKLVWYSLELHEEVGNGGFLQYFYNDAGDHAVELLHLLQDARMESFASILQRSCNVFPRAKPSRHRMVRLKSVDKFTSDERKTLDQLSSQYYQLFGSYDNLAAALWEYWQNAAETATRTPIASRLLRYLGRLWP